MTPEDTALDLLKLRWSLTNGRAKFNDEIVAVWAEAIGDLEPVELRTACMSLTRDGDAELRLASIVARARSARSRPTTPARLDDRCVTMERAAQWSAAIALAKAEHPIRQGERPAHYGDRLHRAIQDHMHTPPAHRAVEDSHA